MENKKLDGRYQIQKLIGKGGMAKVYQARDDRLDRNVAIKVMYENLQEDEEFVQRFHREAQALAKISHPHVVQIHNVGIEDAMHYMVMELMQGPTLRQKIDEQGKIEPLEAISIMIQLLKGLGKAHQNGIIHRDLKPQNIMLGMDGHWKIMDFGAAKLLSSLPELTKSGSFIGTVPYFSPEQALGKKVGIPSDLYAVGVVLFEMVTGRLPFDAEETIALALKHVNEPVPDPRQFQPDLPDVLCQVLFKALAKDPADRYRSADEMIVALEKVAAKLKEKSSEPRWIEEKREEPETNPDHQPPIDIKSTNQGKTANPVTTGKKKIFWMIGSFLVMLIFIWGYHVFTVENEKKTSLTPGQMEAEKVLDQTLVNLGKMKGIQLHITEKIQLGNQSAIHQEADVVLQGNELFVQFPGSDLAEMIEGENCYRGKVNEEQWQRSLDCLSFVYKNYHPKELLSQLKAKSYIRQMDLKNQNDHYLLQLKLDDATQIYPLIESFNQMKEVKPDEVDRSSLHMNLSIDKKNKKVSDIQFALNVKHKDKNWFTQWFREARYPAVQAHMKIKMMGEGTIRSSAK
ncbi:protein kinase domain-containing protein [Thermoflavimicrobium dichotomicum]|uniref:Serine/threonine-protein kinase PrkC n=1 Tax=Thermoflavimicrobium dichotomicum TaxID=46223 RepID=A0A1I3KIC2_9BACL|nr:protein kinase [Thermoflavimicrobium dichotomicum]SFI72100.1 Serine/threonine protein kinase [Thermoflavimicrobium dichotomicum]